MGMVMVSKLDLLMLKILTVGGKKLIQTMKKKILQLNNVSRTYFRGDSMIGSLLVLGHMVEGFAMVRYVRLDILSPVVVNCFLAFIIYTFVHAGLMVELLSWCKDIYYY